MTGRINVSDFDLATTLECGQAFRWRRAADGWFECVVGSEFWRMRQSGGVLEWDWSRETLSRPAPNDESSRESGTHAVGARLQHYLSLDVSLARIIATFPADDEPLRAAVRKHWGLRVLRQEPWECLASFIASSTKQIVQIRQIIAELSNRFGEPLADHGRAALPRGHADAEHRVPTNDLGRAAARPYHSFPTVGVIARASIEELRSCRLGFRAKNLLAAARMIDSGKVDLHALPSMEYEQALEELLKLPGVGEKIANCALLFSCPVDVWIERALRRLYFPRRTVTTRQLREFARSHFGPYAGWAQQYLFFNERTTARGQRPLTTNARE
jgi:N-glycosylase/DNA lyase